MSSVMGAIAGWKDAERGLTKATEDLLSCGTVDCSIEYCDLRSEGRRKGPAVGGRAST